MKKASGSRRAWHDLEDADRKSSARRILWALVGVVAYTVAYFAAKYAFGF